jgi:signal transduction histidine kinase
MLNQFFGKLARYAKTPEMMKIWALVFIVALLATLNAIFSPQIVSIFAIVTAPLLILSIVILNLRFLETLQELHFRKGEFQSLIESLREGVVIYDTNFRILQLNKVAEEIFQLNQQEIVGRVIGPNLLNNPHYRVVVELLYPSLAPSVTQISEAGVWPQIINLSLEEPHREFRTTLHRVMNEKGEHVGFLKLIKDVTREKSILQSKSEFINTAAHQLRTPLTAMNWALETLAKNVENQDQSTKNLVAEIKKLSERTLKIANDLLDASKIEEGRFGYTFTDVDIVQVIKKVVENILPIAKEYAVRLYFDPRGINSLILSADENRLGIALANLLDNAIRYNIKNGKVVITLQQLTEKPFVKISVEDSGIGINDEDIPKIFQKFFRGANATQVEPNGNGLGLYITRNIVKRHGGEIGFESTINRGSTFWFTLPTDPSLIPPKEISYEEMI